MNQKNPAHLLTERQKYEKQFASGRSYLLIMIIFTIINTVMCLFKSASYFLFSAQVPYELVYDAMWWGGKMSPEDYETYVGVPMDELEFYPDSVFKSMIAIAAAIIIVYLLCWIFSKRDYGWLTGALVLFLIDTVILVLIDLFYYVFNVRFIIDWLFHALVVLSLFKGVIAARKLKKLPADPGPEEFAEESAEPASVSMLNGEPENGNKE